MKLFNLYSNSNNRTFIQRPFKVSTQKRSLRWPMMLNIAMNKYFQSLRKTKYSKLKESPEADPHTRRTNQQIPLDSWQMIHVGVGGRIVLSILLCIILSSILLECDIKAIVL